MITLVTALGSLILALISVISHLLTKNKDSNTVVQNQAVADEIRTNDAKIQANQDQIQQIKDQTAAQEKGETNDQIINDLNSDTPKS